MEDLEIDFMSVIRFISFFMTIDIMMKKYFTCVFILFVSYCLLIFSNGNKINITKVELLQKRDSESTYNILCLQFSYFNYF